MPSQTESSSQHLAAAQELLDELQNVTQRPELIDLGDRLVMLAELPTRGQTSGVPVSEQIATVSVLKDGRAIRVQSYLHHAEALEAVGLRE